jgi:hypothetical protein
MYNTIKLKTTNRLYLSPYTSQLVNEENLAQCKVQRSKFFKEQHLIT